MVTGTTGTVTIACITGAMCYLSSALVRKGDEK